MAYSANSSPNQSCTPSAEYQSPYRSCWRRRRRSRWWSFNTAQHIRVRVRTVRELGVNTVSQQKRSFVREGHLCRHSAIVVRLSLSSLLPFIVRLSLVVASDSSAGNPVNPIRRQIRWNLNPNQKWISIFNTISFLLLKTSVKTNFLSIVWLLIALLHPKTRHYFFLIAPVVYSKAPVV